MFWGFTRFGRGCRLAGLFTLSPEGPTAPTATITAGAADGQVVFDVTAVNTDWGDAVNHGDGMGTAGVLEWWNRTDGWQTLIDPEDTGTVSAFAGPLLWGRSEEIRLRRKNAQGRAGAAIAATVAFEGVMYLLGDWVLDGTQVALDGTPMSCLTIDPEYVA